MSYSNDLKAAIRTRVNMLKKQIINTQSYIECHPYSETLSQQEHLEIIKTNYQQMIDTYPEVLI